MSFKSLVTSRIIALIVDQNRLAKRAARFEKARQSKAKPHEVIFFHDVTDPYSHLLLTVIADLWADTDVHLTCHLIAAPQANVTPERGKLAAYALKDTRILAQKTGLDFDAGQYPSDENVDRARPALAQAFSSHALDTARDISCSLWSGNTIQAVDFPWQQAQATGIALLQKRGHYQGGMLYYGGEWYWGLDRLHYLQTRLFKLGVGQESLVFAPPVTPVSTGNIGGQLDCYVSFRSPYSYLALNRVIALTQAYNIKLNLRYVLPMVMRGLPVPKTKRFYLLHDAAHEAYRMGLPFGRIADPLGKAVERGYALMPWARGQGKDAALACSFTTAVWSQGIDAASNAGLKRIVENAGLSWGQAQTYLNDDSWRAEAEDNRQALTGLGLWGVPSFCYDGTAVWGQDRLWVIEDLFCEKI
ncbi:MAG: DsbA family protein [Amylibacter sp.]|nr:DsbA family protein [Amylibacter sp.]